MKNIFSGIIISFCIMFCVTQVSASVYDDVIGDGNPEIRYCQGNECGLENGIDVVKDGLGGLETERSASEYIQSVIVYLLSFISLIAVIYIIYSGFQILVGNGEEEKLKKSKQTILYVIIGIILIWLAWPITNFIFDVLGA